MFPTELIRHVVDYSATGSRVIVNPPVMDTDEDYLVLVNSYTDITKTLTEAGFSLDGKDYKDAGPGSLNSRFKSFSKDKVNLIVSDNRDFFERSKLATRIATALNLSKKEDRIALFHLLRAADLRPSYGPF